MPPEREMAERRQVGRGRVSPQPEGFYAPQTAADEHGMAGGRDGIDHQGCRLLAANGVEGVVGTKTSGQFLHALEHILVPGIDGVRCAELARVGQLVVEQVAGDDDLGPGKFGALHDIEPDTATADHQHRGARLDVGMADDGADAGGDATADDGGVRPGQILAHRHHLLGRTDNVLRKRADAGHLVDGFAIELQARAAVMHAPARAIIVAAA